MGGSGNSGGHSGRVKGDQQRDQRDYPQGDNEIKTRYFNGMLVEAQWTGMRETVRSKPATAGAVVAMPAATTKPGGGVFAHRSAT